MHTDKNKTITKSFFFSGGNLFGTGLYVEFYEYLNPSTDVIDVTLHLKANDKGHPYQLFDKFPFFTITKSKVTVSMRRSQQNLFEFTLRINELDLKETLFEREAKLNLIKGTEDLSYKVDYKKINVETSEELFQKIKVNMFLLLKL